MAKESFNSEYVRHDQPDDEVVLPKGFGTLDLELAEEELALRSIRKNKEDPKVND